jgi:hypothetical protein
MWVIDNTEITTYRLSAIYSWMGFTAKVRNGKIYISTVLTKKEVIKHEMAHLMQEKLNGYFIFRIKYFYDWIRLFFKGVKPYQENAFEREARYLERLYQGWKYVTKDSWKNFRY